MIPEVGKFYHFWDDGKCGVSRHYIAKCEEIIPIESAETYLIADQYHNKISLLKLWVKEKKHVNWIFSPKTDVIIRCSIPKYDKYDIFFARDKNDGWFSFCTTGWWQGGQLDIDGQIFEDIINDIKEHSEYYSKPEFIIETD